MSRHAETHNSSDNPPPPQTNNRLPKSIWVLGMVSMLMGISTDKIHSLLPLFMVGSLELSVFMVGLIVGIAESTTLIVKVFSGRSVTNF